MTQPRLRSSLLGAVALALVGCGGEPGSTELDETATAAEPAVIALLGEAKSIAYLNLGSLPSADLEAAAIAAVKRGVEVRALLVAGDYDTTLNRFHALETSGVDVDVRTEPVLPGTLAVTDNAALLGSGASVKRTTSAKKVAAARKALSSLLDPPLPPSTTEGLIEKETQRVWPMPDSGKGRLLDLFAAAKSALDLEVYAIEDRAVVRALGEAAARGVKVRVMAEPKTVGGTNYDTIAKELTAAGVEVQPTPPYFDDGFKVDHAKFFLVDDEELVFGSGNLVRSGIGGETDAAYNNRDYWVEDGRKESIAEARALFDADWARQPTKGLAFDNLVVTPDNAMGTLGALVDGAANRLYVENQLLNEKTFLARLVAAKNRAVDVHVLLGYQPVEGKPPLNQPAVDQLHAAGVKVDYLKRYYLHAKAIVADGRVYLGSQNFTKGGLVNNREVGSIVDDPEMVDAVVSAFEDDAGHLEP